MTPLLALLLIHATTAFSFAPPLTLHGVAGAGLQRLFLSPLGNEDEPGVSADVVDRQSDAKKYGRGISHISADLNEGDIICYQAGTWLVDGTEVGDGSEPVVRYLQVDAIQLVWTHDCEHGVINGFDVAVANEKGAQLATGESGQDIQRGSHFVRHDEYIQIGPEQVLARIPTTILLEKGAQVMISCAEFHPGEEMMAST